MRATITVVSLTLSALLATPAAAGQPEDSIAAIRALYQEVGALERAPEGERTNVVTMQLETVQPGTGPQTTTLSYVLGEHRASDEQIYADYYVRKVGASWNIAARSFAAEYLFSGTEPELVFHFATDGETEVRTYFADGQLIRILRKPAPGGPMEIDPVTKDEGFSEHERAEAARIQERAAAHLATFRAMEGAMTREHGS